MTDFLDDITAKLGHFTHEQVIALIQDFLAELGEPQQQRFLALVSQGPRPLATEAMELEDAEELLASIRELHDAIENGQYVEYGSGYDPDYGDYRGFGDDSWIEEMDDLFAAATSLFRAGRFEAAAEAYLELFHIFDLAEDGFLFTRPDPQEALQTNLDVMKRNYFIAVARSERKPAAKAVERSADLAYVAHNAYALLDAWQGHEELMAALETKLISLTRVDEFDQCSPYGEVLSHPADLLRELYRRHRDTPACEALCRQVGRQQGWPYVDLVQRYQEMESWEQVLAWADDGLAKLLAGSRYRPALQEARGQALLRLARPAEAYDELLALFGRERTTPVYLKLREAAQGTGRWGTLYPQLASEMQKHVLTKTWQEGYSAGDLMVAGLLGYARLLEGDWRGALEWALNPAIPTGWRDGDLVHTVATGLLWMGVVTQAYKRDDVLAQELDTAPRIIREYGEHLEAVAHTLPVSALLDAAVRLYEHLVERAVGGRDRDAYARAGAYCRVIRSIRRLQKREADFERYYQGLFESYRRYPALKDELRKAVEGPGYRRKP